MDLTASRLMFSLYIPPAVTEEEDMVTLRTGGGVTMGM